MSGLLAETDQDRSLRGIYLRAKTNVESLLSLRYHKDFQAIAMVTRSLFESTIDMRLITISPFSCTSCFSAPLLAPVKRLPWVRAPGEGWRIDWPRTNRGA